MSLYTFVLFFFACTSSLCVYKNRTQEARITLLESQLEQHKVIAQAVSAYQLEEQKIMEQAVSAYQVQCTKEKHGNTPLHLAAKKDQSAVVRYLVSQGASLEAKNDFGYTPLHNAAANGHLEMVKWLLAHGALINAKAKRGWTPLSVASGKRMEAYLKSQGAK